MKSVFLSLVFLCSLAVSLALWHNPTEAQQVNSSQQSLVGSPQIKSDTLNFEFAKASSSNNASFAIAENVIQSENGLVLADHELSGSIISEMINVPIHSPEPFLSVHPTWTVEFSGGEGVTVSIRASIDGYNWGEWKEISADDDSSSKFGEYAGSSVYFDKQTMFVQYRILIGRDSQGISPKVINLQIVFISPGVPSKEPLRQGEHDNKHNTELRLFSASPVPKPPVVSRDEWGCPGNLVPSDQEEYTQATHLIIHHTTDQIINTTDYAAIVREIWAKHAVLKGWGDIGYHYLIDPNGVIYEGRAGGELSDGSIMKGFHFTCANSNAMGIAFIGDFSSDTPTSSAWEAAVNLLAWKSAQRNIDPLGSSYHPVTQLYLMNISGHRDANNSPAQTVINCGERGTSCPGEFFYSVLPVMRRNVRSRIGGDCTNYSVPNDHWRGEYFNNRDLSGSPTLIRDDGARDINFNWGDGNPGSACFIGSDNFSVRWTNNAIYLNSSAIYRL